MPTIVVCTTAFATAGKARAASLGMPRVPIVLIEHPIAGEPLPVVYSRADAVFEQIVQLLTSPQAVAVEA